jgi:hypothetical protein
MKIVVVDLAICVLAALFVAGLACLLGSAVGWLWGIVGFFLQFVVLCIVQTILVRQC